MTNSVRPHPPGFRRMTVGLRRSETAAESWCGMPKGVTKGHLLSVLEDVPADELGVTQAALDFARGLVKLQPPKCFKSEVELRGEDLQAAGLAMISTYSDARLMARFKCSRRTLARWRAQLASAGLIAFRDSGNRSRFRTGDPEAPSNAYGVDLRPIVVRYQEMIRLRDEDRQRQQAIVVAINDLKLARNRIKVLRPLLLWDDGTAERALKAYDGVRNKHDLDVLDLGLQQMREAIMSLEQAISTQHSAVDSVSGTAPGRDIDGAQITPTPLNPAFKKGGAHEEIEEYGHDPASSTPAKSHDAGTSPQRGADRQAEADLGSGDGLTQGGFIWDAVEDSEAFPGDDNAEYIDVIPGNTHFAFQRVTLPSQVAILAALPGLLRKKNFAFGRSSLFPDDKSLVIAHGRSSACRIGFSETHIREAEAEHGALAFTTAALLAEFTDGVRDRRAYLIGILNRLGSPRHRVPLDHSWKRLVLGLNLVWPKEAA